MKKIIKILLISTVTILLIFTIALPNSNEKEFENYLFNLNSNRKNFVNNSNPTDLSKYQITYTDEKTVISKEKAGSLLEGKRVNISNINKIIPYEEAVEDINIAFDILKYSYGAYEYFGGEDVFNKVKVDILESLLNEESIKYDTIENLLFNGLEPIIKDGHFRAGNRLINANKNLITAVNKDYYFSYENNKYYTHVNNKRYYLKDIDGDSNIENYMKLTISEDGSLTYSIGIFVNNNDSFITKEITLVDTNGQELKEQVSINKNFIANKEESIAYKEDSFQGIPILDVNSMRPKSSSDKSLDLFIESGQKYKDEPILIIDLRGNTGGSDRYYLQWIKNYLGKYIDNTKSYIRKKSRLVLIQEIDMLENEQHISKENEEVLNSFKKELESGEYEKWFSSSVKGEFTENENKIFVLIDKDVASSGEGFVDTLRHMENVIFVGGNTRGCHLVTNLSHYQLPNSKVTLSFGDGIIIRAEGENNDAIGFEPDIWVDSRDSLEATITLINKYNLDKR
ncbi:MULTISPECIES: S41 family peptidase [unclassified Clostridium]|uniref:S41 family peptidase n=1 Tax=unclassified Clostridium TaxID=2614128 RepID=UPI0025C30C89|nr:S41 family peptidase [Clostridium sp.]MDY4253205.1 S41 family peptidase [Clostridium sp.]